MCALLYVIHQLETIPSTNYNDLCYFTSPCSFLSKQHCIALSFKYTSKHKPIAKYSIQTDLEIQGVAQAAHQLV